MFLARHKPGQQASIKDGSGWQRQAILGLFPLLAGLSLLAACVFVPEALRGNADFRSFYAGGYMMRTGLRHWLYDPAFQKRTEDTAVSPSAQMLPINHPAYEFLFFAPLSVLPYRWAYMTWGTINLLVLVFCGIRLARILDPWLTFALLAGFVPVWATLMHGQDSLWVLFWFVFAFESRSEMTAGLYLGMTAFRFHLLIPILVLFALWKAWRVVLGALLVAVPLAVLSVWLVGIRGTFLYVSTAAATTEVRNGPAVNLFGVCQGILGGQHNRIALLLAIGFAIPALLYALSRKPSLGFALLMLPLASYRLMVHDLVFLLIPISILLRRGWAGVFQVGISVLGFFPPVACLCALPSVFLLCDWPTCDVVGLRKKRKVIH